MKINNKYTLIYLGKKINLKISPKSNFIYDESTVPYISNYYYEAKIYSNENFKLQFNNCEFLEKPILDNYAKTNAKFNNCIIPE